MVGAGVATCMCMHVFTRLEPCCGAETHTHVNKHSRQHTLTPTHTHVNIDSRQHHPFVKNAIVLDQVPTQKPAESGPIDHRFSLVPLYTQLPLSLFPASAAAHRLVASLLAVKPLAPSCPVVYG